MAWRRACAIAAVVVSAACSAPATPSTDDAPAALDFAAPAVGGGTVDLRSFTGTTLALWFWAPY